MGLIWCGSYRMKSAKKGIQNGQLELYVADVFSVGLAGTTFPSLPFPFLPLPREKREKEKQKRKNQRKE